MTSIYITDNVLLQNDRAVQLYRRFAKDLPNLDHHGHLPPEQIVVMDAEKGWTHCARPVDFDNAADGEACHP